MRKHALHSVLAAGVALTLSILGCRPQGPRIDANTVTIGAILPLTGFVSYLGEEERNVLMMAEEELNVGAPTQKVRVLVEDSKTTAKDGVAAYQKLRLQGVRQVITSLTIVSEAVKPLCEQDGVLQFALSIHPDISRGATHLVRPYYGLEDEMRVAAEACARLGAKRVAALYINTPEYVPGIQKYFAEALAARGIALVGTETYEFSDRSVRSQLMKLKPLEPDVIMTGDFGYMYPTILREAASLDLREKILGTLGLMTAPPMPTELTKGIVFVSPAFAITRTASYRDFAAKYKIRFGKALTFDGVYTYDAFRALYEGVRSGRVDKKSFVGTKHAGLSGTVAIDENGAGKVDIGIGRKRDDGTNEGLRSDG